MLRYNMRDTVQQALGFLTSQVSYIEPLVYKIQYPDILYRQLIPIDTSAPEWAKSITFFSSDKFGAAQWFNHMADDIPVADTRRNVFEHGVEMAGIGYRYTLEELGQASMINMNLTADRAEAARRASEEFIDNATLRGDTVKGWKGLFNDAAITIQTIPADGTGSSTTFASKTPSQIMRDINAALTGIWSSTQTIEMADTILWPLAVSTYLGSTQMPNTTMTLWSWIQQNNQYTQTTGQPIFMRAVRGLDTAGAGGITRAVFYRRDPQILKVHIPMPHRFLPVFQSGPIKFDIPGIFRFGGLEIRRPGSVRYMDGV
jgi:hypothetical protein